MAEKTQRTTTPSTPHPADGIAEQLLPGLRQLLADSFSAVAGEVNTANQARFTSLEDQQQALGKELGEINNRFEQLLLKLQEQKSVPELFRTVVDKLPDFNQRRRAASLAADQGTLTTAMLDEVRKGFDDLLQRLDALETQVNTLSEQVVDHTDQLGQLDTRVSDLENKPLPTPHDVDVRRLLGYQAGADGNPTQLTVIADMQKSLHLTAARVIGLPESGTHPAYPGLVETLGVDANGNPLRINQIETDLEADKKDLHVLRQRVTDLEQNQNNVPIKPSAAVGGVIMVVVFIIAMVLFHASFGAALIAALSLGGVATGVMLLAKPKRASVPPRGNQPPAN